MTKNEFAPTWRISVQSSGGSPGKAPALISRMTHVLMGPIAGVASPLNEVTEGTCKGVQKTPI